ncbi:unnamed protein product [Rhizophagus irregularis]|nr:unnamed protein product [Rhizophagus irregularis]
MAYDNNNQPLVDYLKVKQHINNLGDSSFFNFLKVGLREYAANNINKKHIVDTVKQTAGEDLVPYEALLSEFQDVFSTFRMKNLTKLYHFLFIVFTYS